jgi:hypothetical protein
MNRDAESSDLWIGISDTPSLKKARIFIDNLEMLTDLCIYRPNRVVDYDEKKKKKSDDQENEED